MIYSETTKYCWRVSPAQARLHCLVCQSNVELTPGGATTLAFLANFKQIFSVAQCCLVEADAMCWSHTVSLSSFRDTSPGGKYCEDFLKLYLHYLGGLECLSEGIARCDIKLFSKKC